MSGISAITSSDQFKAISANPPRDMPLNYSGCVIELTMRQTPKQMNFIPLEDFINWRLSENKVDAKLLDGVMLSKYISSCRIFDALAGVDFATALEHNAETRILDKAPRVIKVPKDMNAKEKSGVVISFSGVPEDVFNLAIFNGLLPGIGSGADLIQMQLRYAWMFSPSVDDKNSMSTNFIQNISEFKMLRNLAYVNGQSLVNFDLVGIPNSVMSRTGSFRAPVTPIAAGSVTVYDEVNKLIAQYFESDDDAFKITFIGKVTEYTRVEKTENNVSYKVAKLIEGSQLLSELTMEELFNFRGMDGSDKAIRNLMIKTGNGDSSKYGFRYKGTLDSFLSALADILGVSYTYASGLPAFVSSYITADDVKKYGTALPQASFLSNVTRRKVPKDITASIVVTQHADAVAASKTPPENQKQYDKNYQGKVVDLSMSSLQGLVSATLNSKDNKVQGLDPKSLVIDEKTVKLTEFGNDANHFMTPQGKSVGDSNVPVVSFIGTFAATDAAISSIKELPLSTQGFKTSFQQGSQFVTTSFYVNYIDEVEWSYNGQLPIHAVINPKLSTIWAANERTKNIEFQADISIDADWERYSALVSLPDNAVSSAATEILWEKTDPISMYIKSQLNPTGTRDPAARRELLALDKVNGLLANLVTPGEEQDKFFKLINSGNSDLYKNFAMFENSLALIGRLVATKSSKSGSTDVTGFTNTIKNLVYKGTAKQTDGQLTISMPSQTAGTTDILPLNRNNDTSLPGYVPDASVNKRLTESASIDVGLATLGGNASQPIAAGTPSTRIQSAIFSPELNKYVGIYAESFNAEAVARTRSRLNGRRDNFIVVSPIRVAVEGMVGHGNIASNSVVFISDVGEITGLYRVQTCEHIWASGTWQTRAALLWDEQLNQLIVDAKGDENNSLSKFFVLKSKAGVQKTIIGKSTSVGI